MKHALVALLLCWTWLGVTPGRVIDGDTFLVTIEIAPEQVWTPRVRVLGVDTPELHGATLAAAQAAKDFTAAWLQQGNVSITGCKLDSFGRLLGKVTRNDEDLAAVLIKAGHGIPR